MIINYSSSLGTFEFLTSEFKKDYNKFTIIVGKNGTGKSRLLTSVVENARRHNTGRVVNISEPLFLSIKPAKRKMETLFSPNRVIAVSTSPFDRFPTKAKNDYYDNKYTYLGLKDIANNNLSVGYLSKTINALILSMLNDSSKINSILKVLNYLEYTRHIEANFKLVPTARKINSLVNSLHPEMDFENYLNSNANKYLNRNFFYEKNGKLDKLKVAHAFEIFENMPVSIKQSKFNIVINDDGVSFHNYIFKDLSDLEFLFASGIANLSGIIMSKDNINQTFNISDASSGEQSVVMSLLGIASKIEDGSLICIDEPEVCLHPEWQEKYISLLISTFKDYKKCHFIIATHSPQIVSKLNNENCFIMSMEDGKAQNAHEVRNRSVDFQLAEVFKSPGYKNEYLSREFISFLTSFGEGENLSAEKISRMKKLIVLEDMIDSNDPVKKLLEMVKEVVEEYL